MHGFALNVGADLTGFDLIVPCGLPWARPTSMALEMGEGPSVPTLALLASRVARALGAELGIEFAPDIDRAALHDVIRTRDEISKAIEMSRGITRMIGA
jgi:lipoyl(octanoyl) transferase